jgi:hypothetical protein
MERIKGGDGKKERKKRRRVGMEIVEGMEGRNR